MGLRPEEQPGDPPHRVMLVLKRPEPESWRVSVARVELKGLRGTSRAGENEPGHQTVYLKQTEGWQVQGWE